MKIPLGFIEITTEDGDVEIIRAISISRIVKMGDEHGCNTGISGSCGQLYLQDNFESVLEKITKAEFDTPPEKS